jgi:RNA polymerase sigma factor (sigma-70 family)
VNSHSKRRATGARGDRSEPSDDSEGSRNHSSAARVPLPSWPPYENEGRCRERMYRCAWRHLSGPNRSADADDVASDTMLKIHDALPQFAGADYVRWASWTNAIVRTVRVDFQRRTGRIRDHTLSLDAAGFDEDGEEWGLAHVLPAPDSPESELIAQEGYEELLRKIRQVCSRRRDPLVGRRDLAIVRLRERGESVKSVSEILDVTESVVNNALHFVRRALADAYPELDENRIRQGPKTGAGRGRGQGERT